MWVELGEYGVSVVRPRNGDSNAKFGWATGATSLTAVAPTDSEVIPHFQLLLNSHVHNLSHSLSPSKKIRQKATLPRPSSLLFFLEGETQNPKPMPMSKRISLPLEK